VRDQQGVVQRQQRAVEVVDHAVVVPAQAAVIAVFTARAVERPRIVGVDGLQDRCDAVTDRFAQRRQQLQRGGARLTPLADVGMFRQDRR
jgi:hypothetical protein